MSPWRDGRRSGRFPPPPDPDALAGLLSDDVVHTHSDGSVHDEAAYVESVRSGDLVHRRVAFQSTPIRR